jgi:hypothetical protein
MSEKGRQESEDSANERSTLGPRVGSKTAKKRPTILGRNEL